MHGKLARMLTPQSSSKCSSCVVQSTCQKHHHIYVGCEAFSGMTQALSTKKGTNKCPSQISQCICRYCTVSPSKHAWPACAAILDRFSGEPTVHLIEDRCTAGHELSHMSCSTGMSCQCCSNASRCHALSCNLDCQSYAHRASQLEQFVGCFDLTRSAFIQQHPTANLMLCLCVFACVILFGDVQAKASALSLSGCPAN